MEEPGVEVLEKPEQQIEALPYDEQEVLVERYPYFKRLKRIEAVREHLKNVDPTLEKWASKFGSREGQIKDISYSGYFHPEFSLGQPDELEPKDLVLVHLTDTFPEDGIIRTTNFFRPEILRRTIHFTLNGPVVEEQQFGVGNWEKKKYVILIPFEKVMDRVEELSTDDTFILEDLELPEGSLVLAGNSVHLPSDRSKAGKASMAIENFGRTPWDLRKAVFRAILSEGYCPMRQGSYGWVEWSHSPSREILEEFCKKYGVELGGLHDYHWTAHLEDQSIWLMAAKEKGDPQEMQSAIAEAERFIEQREDVPQEYKNKLKELVERYKSGNQEGKSS